MINDKSNHNNENMNGTNGTGANKEVTYTYGPSPRSTADLQSTYEKQLEMFEVGAAEGGAIGARVGKRARATSAKTVLAAFLAGAIVIGGFMYAADRNNLFTGDGEETAIVSQTASNAASSSQDAGVKTASASVDQSISDIYAEASPAVVKIENYTEPQQTAGRGSDYWQFFGGQTPQQQFGKGRNGTGEGGSQEQGAPQSESNSQSEGIDTSNLQLSGSGTGFIFDKSGYILTNEHVIADAAQVKVTVEGYDEPFVATVVGSDAEQDLAVLKIEGTDEFSTLPIGNSDDSAIGDWVIAIGNPYGFDHTMTVGVLSAKERPITIADESGEHVYEHLLQTDASINPGNSGGPLLNASGEVIGINTAVNSEAQGIGFAIPTGTIQEVLNTIMGANTL
ncbi:S1C family serine protease [Paenibacillus sp. NEAU-GSW1]|uniref:S1C family serine protease n=1 Tax=Paenibacillus sp. NEAU-GSW1 TaxID=2682486 RepID=UPI0012E17DBB|nr:trypsin-like peptidase domain-containing protein [Paenibacillus sp. NEAU-GSW1]MUT68001.1 trypsin-like serine protease [Paenibacillus sp. NEAU-GSW1]